MIQALNTAAVGMKSQQQMIDTISNNIANINTTGFKRDRADFQDALYVRMQDASNAESTANLQKGTGALVGSTSRSFTVGSLMATGAPLDVALQDENAFFVVEDRNGEQKYTRDGNFQLSQEGGESYLVTKSGDYVLGTGGERISINVPASALTIDHTGNITDGENDFGQLNTVRFVNPEGLSKLGGNCYQATEASGEPEALGNDVKMNQGYLESSNVDLGQEVTDLIRAQRAYQLASRIIQVADNMEEKANNLRR